MDNGDLLLLAVADATVDGQRLEGVLKVPDGMSSAAQERRCQIANKGIEQLGINATLNDRPAFEEQQWKG